MRTALQDGFGEHTTPQLLVESHMILDILGQIDRWQDQTPADSDD